MVSTLKNSDGLVYAYMAWRIVDEKGYANNSGHYLYIVDTWIHDSYRKNRTLKNLFLQLDRDPRVKDVAGIYWENLKRNERLTPLYQRSKLAMLAGKETSECVLS